MDLLPVQQDFHIPGKNPGVPKPDPGQLVDLAIDSQIDRIKKRASVDGGESFFVADLGHVTQQHRRWMKGLPGVQPYYGTVLRLK